jgi:uncharacterized repeat protein (TIGR01451 family)
MQQTRFPGPRLRPLAAAGLFALVLGLVPVRGLAQTYTQSATPYNFIATAGHTVLAAWAGGMGCPDTVGDDSLSAALNIGFNFKLGATTYTQLRVSTNGRLQFGNTFCNFGTQAVGPPRTYTDPYASANLNNTLRIYGADFDVSPAGGGTITYATVGAAPNRRFVVTWNAVRQWSAPGTSYQLQIQLDESGDFYYMFGTSNNVTSPGGEVLGPAQVGWQLTTTDFAVVRSGLPANNSGMVFKPARPALVVAKTSEVLSDPVNAAVNPKRIPGAVIRYSVTVTNTGTGTVDASTLAITDPVPSGTELYVGNVSGQAVDFINGATASGLAFAFPANVSYSNQPGGGAPFNYTPVPNAAGYDSAVTGLRIAPTGVMNAAAGAATPSFTVRFRTRIR